MRHDSNTPQRVLDIGNCVPDHQAIRRLIESHFDARVEQAEAGADALAALLRERFDLVLVNRKLDCDHSDGLEVIRQIKRQPELSGVPCMLVTNHEEHQQQAIEAGAERGFGKLELGRQETLDRLRAFL